MSRPKVSTRGKLNKYTIFDQRRPTRKEYRNGEPYYEANLARVGEVEALSPSAALDEAKRRGMSAWPIVWGQDTEAKRERRKFRDED